MQTLILTLHIIVCFLLVILILLQSGKEGMGVIFGGGNSSVFGSTGAGGILAKLTTLMAIIFVITSLSYTYVTSSHPETESQILDVRIEEPVPAPAATPEAVPAKPAPETPAPAASGDAAASSASGQAPAENATQPQTAPNAAQDSAKPAQPSGQN